MEDFGADGFGDGKGCVIDELGVQVGRLTRDFGEDGFDAVGGGAGHEAKDQERIFGHGKFVTHRK